MSFRHTASFALCAAAGLTMIAAPANACDNPSCFEVHPAQAAQPVQAAQPQTAAPGKPLPLAKVARKPVATAAVRTTKTRNGNYVQVAYKHPVKTGAATKPLEMPVRPVSAAATPAAEALASAAAQAFASVPYATARVRVVTPEDLKEIDAQGKPGRLRAGADRQQCAGDRLQRRPGGQRQRRQRDRSQGRRRRASGARCRDVRTRRRRTKTRRCCSGCCSRSAAHSRRPRPRSRR